MKTAEWKIVKKELLRIIRMYKPDIIQCFGTEWPYGLIAEATPVPVVIHIMGFLNIYYTSLAMVTGRGGKQDSVSGNVKNALYRCKRLIRNCLLSKPVYSGESLSKRFELRNMRVNRYFMGRTNWDKAIVKYYSKDGTYYHVPEVMKETICRAAGTWNYTKKKKLRLLTISSADDRTGNEVMLRTARLLKELIGMQFEWRVAGEKSFFLAFERYTGIDRESVNVKLIGRIAPKTVVEELQRADFFIHPSIIDNSPNSICEAQLVGCPVLASNVGGIPQLVEDSVTGFLYPYNEPHTLAFLIDSLRENEDLLTKISRTASETAQRRHDSVMIADRLVSVYREIIKNHPEERCPE